MEHMSLDGRRLQPTVGSDGTHVSGRKATAAHRRCWTHSSPHLLGTLQISSGGPHSPLRPTRSLM